MRHIIYLSIFIALFATSLATAQPISKKNPDLKLLEHLIKKKIDNWRVSEGRHPLYSDTLVYKMAKDHLDYQFEKKKNGHFQSEYRAKETVEKRAVFYGLTEHFVALKMQKGKRLKFVPKAHAQQAIEQLVLFKSVPRRQAGQKAKSYYVTDYGRAANVFIELWQNDEKAKKVLLDKNVQIIGVAVGYDEDLNELKVVVNVAWIEWFYDFQHDPSFFKHEQENPRQSISSFEEVKGEMTTNFAWDLKPSTRTDSDCEVCNTNPDAHKSYVIKEEGSRLLFHTDDTELAAQLFTNEFDGVAIEMVSYRPYDCGNPAYYEEPSRRNKLSIFNGEIQEPVYKADIFKLWDKEKTEFAARKERKLKALEKALKNKKLSKKNRARKQAQYDALKKKEWQPQDLTFTIGRIPKNETAPFEYNILLIRNKKVCRTIHFSGYCGESYFPFKELPYRHHLKAEAYDVPVKKEQRQFTFTVPFEKNKTEFEFADIQPFMDTLGKREFIARKIAIQAFASVEGNPEINHRLQRERAESIIAAIRGEQVEQDIKTDIKTATNWNRFYEQIVGTAYADWRGKPKTEVVQLLRNEETEKELTPWLVEQRKAIITLDVDIMSPDEIKARTLLKQFHSALDSVDNKGEIQAYYEGKAIEYQDNIYYGIQVGDLSKNTLRRMEIKGDTIYRKINNNQWVMEWELLPKGKDPEPTIRRYYNRLNKLATLDGASIESKYNLLAFLVNHWQGEILYDTNYRPENILAMMADLERQEFDGIDWKVVGLQVHFKSVQYYRNVSGKAARKRFLTSAEYLFDYYKEQELTEAEVLRLARFFVWGQASTFAMKLLEPFAKVEQPDVDIYSLYLKLKYEHPEEYSASTYPKILMEAIDIISKEKWCELFLGRCGISFQIFDYPALRELYCEECRK